MGLAFSACSPRLSSFTLAIVSYIAPGRHVFIQSQPNELERYTEHTNAEGERGTSQKSGTRPHPGHPL